MFMIEHRVHTSFSTRNLGSNDLSWIVVYLRPHEVCGQVKNPMPEELLTAADKVERGTD